MRRQTQTVHPFCSFINFTFPTQQDCVLPVFTPHQRNHILDFIQTTLQWPCIVCFSQVLYLCLFWKTTYMKKKWKWTTATNQKMFFDVTNVYSLQAGWPLCEKNGVMKCKLASIPIWKGESSEGASIHATRCAASASDQQLWACLLLAVQEVICY